MYLRYLSEPSISLSTFELGHHDLDRIVEKISSRRKAQPLFFALTCVFSPSCLHTYMLLLHRRGIWKQYSLTYLSFWSNAYIFPIYYDATGYTEINIIYRLVLKRWCITWLEKLARITDRLDQPILSCQVAARMHLNILEGSNNGCH